MRGFFPFEFAQGQNDNPFLVDCIAKMPVCIDLEPAKTHLSIKGHSASLQPAEDWLAYVPGAVPQAKYKTGRWHLQNNSKTTVKKEQRQ